MAVTTALTQSEMSRVMSAAYNTKILTASLVNASSPPSLEAGIASWLQYELTEGTNGYGRFQSSALTGGSYVSAATRYEQSAISVEFAASGGTLVYTHVLLMIDAASDGMAGGGITASSDVNVSTDTITVNAHGLSNGDAVTLTADAGGAVPTGSTAGTLYYVSDVTTNTVKLNSSSGGGSSNVIDLTATGSGTLRLRKCAGSVYGLMTETSAVTIADGQTIGYSVKLAVDD